MVEKNTIANAVNGEGGIMLPNQGNISRVGSDYYDSYTSTERNLTVVAEA
jgi:hypothetical protein